MKCSTILSSLALAAVAHSQPLLNPEDSSVQSGVEARDTHYCCVEVHFYDKTYTKYIPYTGSVTGVDTQGACALSAFQGNVDTKQGYCNGWVPMTRGCDSFNAPHFHIRPANSCH
ncbi:hypothetical protein E4U43_004753 [Claviceps pusilla]|uniref:Small secreted protein n=1 Tax=Claviceps pusilla TaxID=123648 RepID=A0A9P7N5G6_9HYPO|nr:hypothetical protein E4U43_004753 [Claviceps pusilla]